MLINRVNKKYRMWIIRIIQSSQLVILPVIPNYKHEEFNYAFARFRFITEFKLYFISRFFK